MTNEQLAATIQADREEFKELLPVLWKRVNGILFLKSREFYNKHRDQCCRCGVELGDIDGSLYEVFLSALDAYDPSADTLFTSYFSYPFKNMTAELLGYRTERGRREPLNNCDSLDRPISTDEGEDSTLGDFIQDPAAGFEDDVIEGLNREQEAKAVRAAVAALPDPLRQIIEQRYFDDLTLAEIGENMGISAEMVRQYRNKAIKQLRRCRQLQVIYCEHKQHEHTLPSRLMHSPEYFAAIRRAKEKSLSYGQLQAELRRLRQRFADDLEPQDLDDKLAELLGDFIDNYKPPADRGEALLRVTGEQ